MSLSTIEEVVGVLEPDVVDVVFELRNVVVQSLLDTLVDLDVLNLGSTPRYFKYLLLNVLL